MAGRRGWSRPNRRSGDSKDVTNKVEIIEVIVVVVVEVIVVVVIVSSSSRSNSSVRAVGVFDSTSNRSST